MNDVLINSFGELFNLPPSKLSYIQLSFFGVFGVVSLIYFLVSSISKKDPINKIGYKNGMSISLLICGIGCASFYPSAIQESYNGFIFSLAILSIGITLLQICANPYAAILGDESSASSRLNLAQGFNSLGTTLGPIVGSILIFSVFGDGDKSLNSIGITYLIYGITFITFAIIVKLSKLPPFINNDKIEGGLEVLKHKNLRYGIIAIFFYVGSEVSIGSWIGTFAKDETIMGLNEKSANYFLSFFWGGLMMGRLMASISLNDRLNRLKKNIYVVLTAFGIFILIWMVTAINVQTLNKQVYVDFSPLEFSEIMNYIIYIFLVLIAFYLGKGKEARSLIVFSSINIALLLIGVFASGEIAFWSILGSGLFFSIGWSNIFSLSIQGLGKLRSQGSALLVMAITGGAVIPWVQSQLIEATDVQTSFLIPVLGMVIIIFYGIFTSRKIS
jgi:FHS family L-fucose permease-like MFS transporter